MNFTPQQLEEKPYNLCLNCVHIGKRCDGPNFLSMDMSRLSEWCRLRKDYLHNIDPKWTNSYIAEEAEMSKTTVDRFLSGNADDLKMSSASQIMKVLINGSWGQYPCAMAGLGEEYNGDCAALEAECKRLQDIIDIKNEEYTDKIQRIEFLLGQISTKDRLLDERADFLRIKDKYIRILGTLFAVCLLIFICLLVVDIVTPDIGFLWTDTAINSVTHQNGIPAPR